MTASIVNVTNSTSTTGTSMTVNMPTSPTVGNLLVMIFGWYGDITIGGLSAWTQQEIAGGTASRVAVYTRVVDGTESSSYTITGFALNADPRNASVIQVSGQSGYDIGDALNVAETTIGSGVWDVVNTTTVTPDDLVIRAVYGTHQSNTVTYTWSGSTTPQADFNTAIASGWYGHLSVVSQTAATAGTTPSVTVTRSPITDSVYAGVATIAIKPSGVTAGGQGSFFTFFTHGIGTGSVAPPPPPPPPPVNAVNRPANPALICYAGTSGSVSAWAQPGALVVTGRDNYNDAAFHTMAAGGATVIVYLDALLNNTTGRYHGKLVNASEFGPAVPIWPPGFVGNQFGSLTDFRVGGILQSKLPGVLNLILDENPHVSGFFLDDCGSRSWYPSFDWNSFPDKEGYRNGAIAICQTARNVADARNCFVMVNGTWGANATSGIGDGGYPVRGQHGMSLVDGGFVENHAYDAYWQNYMSSTQWGAATPRGLAYNWASNVGDITQRNNYVNNNVTAFASTNDYGAGVVAPWRSFTDFGIPHR